MPPQTDLIRIAISQAGLLNPDLKPKDRRAAMLQIACRYDCSEATVRRQFNRMKVGEPLRAARNDRGSSRALSEDALQALHKMVLAPHLAAASVKQLLELLQTSFPDEGITYSTVRSQRLAFLDSLPRAVSTPRRIEVANALDRVEMDLSVMDAFLADPNHNEGFPFRPQLIVAEDAKTRSCMFAQYTRTGKAVDVGATLFNAIIPQSDTWPQCGLPKEVGCDWGKVFLSEYFKSACKGLGIVLNEGHPYYPQDKGKVERVIGTIHNGFENTLIGFTTNDNTGDDAIDPRKFFRQDAGQWLDPRFDQPLLTLDEANRQLWDWIVGTYHRRDHATLGCPPNQAWLREVRGKQITIPERKSLEMQFLPFEQRKVRRGQVQLNGLTFYDAALADYEGNLVTIRYTPDDISRAYCYYDNVRICEAHPAPVFVTGSDTMDWKTFGDIRKDNEAREQERRRVLDDVRRSQIPTAETADMYHARAEDAEPLVLPPPTETPFDPDLAGLTPAQVADLEDLDVYGLPALPARAATG